MKKYIWLFCKLTFVLLILLAFSPLVLSGKTTPYFLGMPHTLWSGLLVSLGFILLTLIGAFVINSKK